MNRSDYEYGPVQPDERRAAMERLMRGGTISEEQAGRLDQLARRLGIDFDRLWVGRDERRRIGPATLIVPRPGRTAVAFISPPRRRRDVAPLVELLRRAVAAVDPAEATLIQALLDPDERLERQAFERAGFTELATLAYLQRSAPTQADHPDAPTGVELLTYDAELRPQFLAALEQSYEQTLDCPQLRGTRETSDVLAGHQATGRFDPSLWTLVRVEGEPAAVLLLNPVPEQRCIELVYLGVGLRHRGRGLGALLLRRCLAQCAARPEGVITVAVDESNAPAVALYRRFGFYRVARKLALIRSLAASAR